MTTAKGKKRYYYYACRESADSCHMDYIPSAPLEGAVLDEIKKIASSPDLIDSHISKLVAKREEKKKELLNHINALNRKLEAAEKFSEQKVNWLMEGEHNQDIGKYVKQRIQNKIGEAKRIRDELTRLDVEMDRLNIEGATADVVCDFLKRFEEIYRTMETGQKRLLVRSVVKEIVVQSRDECRATLTVPLPPMPHHLNGNSPSEINQKKGQLVASYPLCLNWGGLMDGYRTWSLTQDMALFNQISIVSF